jgi:hypothetical protein
MDDNVRTLAGMTAVASRVRHALANLPKDDWPDHWRSFPGGTCADTSLVLCAFLADAGFDGFELMLCERGSQADDTYSSHAWLQRDRLVVDITADQFADGPGPVVVAEDPEWHRGFRVVSKDAGDFREYPPRDVAPARDLYARLKARLDADAV